MHAPTWSEGSELVRATADLLRAVQWPLVTLIIASIFRDDIQKLLARVRRGSLFGAEVELERALDLLEEGADQTEELLEIPEPQPAWPGMAAEERRFEDERDAARIETELAQERDILRTASVSPRAALMLLSSEIEATLRRLAQEDEVEERMPRDTRFLTVGQITRDLTTAGAINERMEENIENLWKVRGLVVHEGQGEDDDVLRAIDSGLTILRTLNRPEPSDESAAAPSARP